MRISPKKIAKFLPSAGKFTSQNEIAKKCHFYPVINYSDTPVACLSDRIRLINVFRENSHSSRFAFWLFLFLPANLARDFFTIFRLETRWCKFHAWQVILHEREKEVKTKYLEIVIFLLWWQALVNDDCKKQIQPFSKIRSNKFHDTICTKKAWMTWPPPCFCSDYDRSLMASRSLLWDMAVIQ